MDLAGLAQFGRALILRDMVAREIKGRRFESDIQIDFCFQFWPP